MEAADLIALVIVLGGGSVGVKLLFSWFKRAEHRDVQKVQRFYKRSDDLRDALKSHDHRLLDDYVVLWGAETSPEQLRHIKERRDELYIEHDNKKASAGQ